MPDPILEVLVSTAVGGGPKHVYDLVTRLSRSEFSPLVAAPPRRERLGEAARARVVAAFSIAPMVRRIEEVYRAALLNRPVAGPDR